MINSNSFTKWVNLESYVRGHHVHKGVWTPTTGEDLLCKMEPNNIKDKYSVCSKRWSDSWTFNARKEHFALLRLFFTFTRTH